MPNPYMDAYDRKMMEKIMQPTYVSDPKKDAEYYQYRKEIIEREKMIYEACLLITEKIKEVNWERYSKV